MKLHVWKHKEVAHQIGWLQISANWRIEFWTYWTWGFVPQAYSLGFVEICKH